MVSSVVYQQKRALIIGINDYPRDPLNYCINDATDLKTTLQRINFDVSLGQNCNLNEFYHIVDTFADTIQRDDLVLFYFAGHGKQKNDENYLLPSDYHYDHRGHEHDYIVNHAINVKYIMEKIDDRKCRITIYLFDCCRLLIRTRAINANQGLLPIHAPLQTLIVFACAPRKTVQDETRNNRNGSFIENLLKYIATPDRDIEEIMKDVACDVNLQTDGNQLPYRTSSLTGKVFLVTNNDQEHHSTAWLKTAILEPNNPGTSSTDINILLLGRTGVGKTTFINAFANYLVHDTLDVALQGDMQVLIPFTFDYCDPDTFDSFEIKVGTPNENEWCHILGVSCTQICQTYTFTIGNRLLRLIDTPSIGDTRGPFQDIKNMQHIFTYISQYKHLNSVCILMKPDELCSTTWYPYSIKEFLSRLHIYTHQNITWVFTYSRATFYMPGRTKQILKTLLNDISSVSFQIIPKNCFLFDNETLRVLALNKDHSEFVHSHLEEFKKSWNKSTAAFGDLLSYILSCKPHVISETFFLNIARQLTYKLIELIDDKTSSRLSVAAINDGSSGSNLEKMFIHNICVSLAHFIKLNSILPFNNEIYRYYENFLYEELRHQSVDYKYIKCLREHSIIPFTNYTMEHINKLFCENLKRRANNTKVLEFLKENAITPFSNYLQKYIRNSFNKKLNEQTSKPQFLRYIRDSLDFSSDDNATKYLCSMFYEELIQQTTSVEYLQFLKENSLIPVNNNIIKLIGQLFKKNSMVSLNNNIIKRICELLFEQLEWSLNPLDSQNIRRLDNLISGCNDLEKLLNINFNEQTALFDVNTIDPVLEMKDILKLLDKLCTLPINGIHIRQYMEDLERTQRDMIGQKENIVKLPASAQSSILRQQLRAIIEQQ